MDNKLFKNFSELMIFNNLSDELIHEIFNISNLVQFNLGEEIIKEGKISGKIYIIMNGNARLIDNIDSKFTTLGKFSKGEILGAASLLSGRSCESIIASETEDLMTQYKNYRGSEPKIEPLLKKRGLD